MIQKVQRLSDLPVLYNLLATGKTIVASKSEKTNYKINLSLLKGKKIIGIEEQTLPDDHINQIRVNFDTGDYKYFNFINGDKGDKGDTGDKGPTGDKGESFNKGQMLSHTAVTGVLQIANDNNTNDPDMVWSAYQGKLMDKFLKSISEVFMTDEEYQLRFNEQIFIDLEFKTDIFNKNSIIIYHDDVKHKTYIKYWTYESESDEKYFYFDTTTNDYVETSNQFDIWEDFYLSDTETEYYTRKLVTTITNQDTGEGISEWVYTKIKKPIWMDIEFETYTEDRNSLLIYSDKELGDDGVVDKDPQEEEIIITHKPITSITVDNPNITLAINEIITKAVNILPADYMNSPICIEYDEEVVKVFEDGRIMAIGKPVNNEAIHTVVKIYSEEDPTIFAEININVVIPVIDIQFDTNIIKSFKSNTPIKINATVLPEDATNKTIIWSSSDPEIASVDENGNVLLKNEGNVTIYAASTDGSNIISRIDVSVDTAVTEINIINTVQAIIGKVGTTINANDLNDLLSMEIFNDESIITVSNNNVSYNARNKNIKLDNLGLSELYIDNGEETPIYKVNIVVSNDYENVIVKNNSKQVLVGYPTTISADVLPESASNKRLLWSPVNYSSNISIASDTNGKDGRVYLSEKGVYDVEVTTQDGTNVKNYITIIGKVPVKTIELDKYILSLDLGETYKLTATVNDDADDKTIVWTSNAPNVVSVDNNGLVKSLIGGDAIITAMANDGSEVFARCSVSSVVLITGITINNGEDINIYAGNEYVIQSNITPENAYNKQLIWYTSDDSIATVTNGKVYALKEGTVKIYAMADDNSGVIASINANISVPVNELLLSDIELTLQVNETYSLIASVIPDNATVQKLVYESENSEIAFVDIDGNIKALKAGTTDIFVTTVDGTNLSKKCTINITD